MANITQKHRAHILAVPYPSQGHICPMLQFCRRLVSKGVKASLAITNHISTTLNPEPDDHVSLVTISDGYDDGGFSGADSVAAYLANLEVAGSQSLGILIEERVGTSDTITCVVYDAFLPWGLNVAKKYGLLGAPFFTQACGVNYVYYLIYHGKFTMPVSSPPVDIQGLPTLDVGDLPSFVGSPESYPAYLELVLNQYTNLGDTDFVLVNTVYELEDEVVDVMSKECPLLTIGPTIPSFYVDNRIPHDKEYGLSLYPIDPTPITNWLSTKPSKSVVYVSFGSMACLTKAQVGELAWGLQQSKYHFLWVVRASEEGKLPKGFVDEKGLIVRWSPQLEVLSSEAIGCFFTHCGWNSTLEALVMGVPIIGMPQWTDQPMDAKFVEDVWKVGVRVKVNDEGLVGKEEIVRCLNEVMEERRGEFIENGKKWKHLMKIAISKGGSSDRNIDEFITKIVRS
ncbi:UDP-glycosyltransferase 74F2-like [Chenopodium quinoa]|uniref:UDP-glycosyltransferase 74F2-like n=1 Tax=Chenopodium quinoa TaxID=63459 RepID=UPI000B779D74|nr:UDP-glycosyltransferase 74F2-like [Chenopodium quinoa]